jgi:hypothetical protein
LLPHGVEIASFVNRHRREIPAGLVRRAKVRHRQINAIQAAWIAYIWNRRAKRHREAAADQNSVQQRIIVDDENMLNRVRGWKVFEAPGAEPVFAEKRQAIGRNPRVRKKPAT